MALPRVIPVLLLRNKGLVKTVKFKEHKYVGDPINAVRIFNEKEVDELTFLDVDASRENREPHYDFLKEIASECFMPLSYGGAVRSLHQIERLLKSGIEKIVINNEALNNPSFIRNASEAFGSSTIVGGIDIKKNFWGHYHVYSHVKRATLNVDPVTHAVELTKLGIGEIFVNNVDLDGTMAGYDTEIIRKITQAVEVPVIACGGAGSIEHIDKVINEAGASAAAAGSFFVFQGKHRAVLITYPEQNILKNIFSKR